MIGIGIDTGGTYTDAVAYDLDNQQVLGVGKALTTHHKLEIGILGALDTLNMEVLKKAKFLSLSTTLATNACVEGIGGLAKLIFINVAEHTVKEMYESYGLPNPEEIYFIDTEVEAWQEQLEAEIENFKAFDSLAVVQIYARENNAKYEKEVCEILQGRWDKPCICGYALFQELNVLRRGASALLNARLIPIIQDFIRAIKQALKERELELPLVIVRSDGSLMSLEFALKHPVETLLCGPAASTIAGTKLTNQRNALVVDMGGTTSDIAIIENNMPVTEKAGISIGNWKTFVKGLYVDTFGLGGDSAVRFAEKNIFLDTTRVIPLSVLATEYPAVIGELEELITGRDYAHSKLLHEFLLLQKDIENHSAYSEEEKELCRQLKKGPLIYTKAATAIGKDIYRLNTEHLERTGAIIRCGLTPTDAMHVKGDFDRFDKRAAELGVQFVAMSTGKEAAEITEMIYERVEKKLYTNLVRILLKHQDTFYEKYEKESLLNKVIEDSYQSACAGHDSFSNHYVTTKAALIGIGAPTHIFLKGVANLLETKVVLPEYAHVANALGAVIGNVSVSCRILLKPVYTNAGIEEYLVYAPNEVLHFAEYEPAKKVAIEVALAEAKKKAIKQGAGEVRVEYQENYSSSLIEGSELFLEEEIVAKGIGRMEYFK